MHDIHIYRELIGNLWLFNEVNDGYHLVMTNIAMERSTMKLIGKPSIFMNHLYHGYVSHNQRVTGYTRWCPSSESRSWGPHNSISLWFMVDISIYLLRFINELITGGAHHIVGNL